MLIVRYQPPKTHFAGNPVRFKLESDNYYSEAGVAAELSISFTDVDPTVGHRITFSLMGKEVSFWLEWPLTDAGNRLPAAQGGWTYEMWCWECFYAFRGNYDLATYYYITCGGTEITFTAKEVGAFYTMDIEANNIVGIAGSRQLLGEDRVLRPAFGVIMQLLDIDDNVFGEDIKPVDSTGMVIFNISDYLSARLAATMEHHLDYPGRGEVNINQYDDYFLRYMIRWAEKFSGSAQRLMYYDDYCYAFPGGISFESLLYWSDGYLAHYMNEYLFLTWHPRVKKIRLDAEERLYMMFINRVNSTDYRVKIDITLNTGETDVHYANVLTAITPYSVIEIMLSQYRLSLPNSTEKFVVSIIDDHDTLISEEFTFEIDNKYAENERLFVFKNSFQCYDIIRCTGVFESSVEYERERGLLIFEQMWEEEKAPPARQLRVSEQEMWKANTGWCSREYKNFLRDFMLSTEIYEIIDGKLWPVIITTKKIGLFRDKVNNYNLEFEYERAYTSEYYTKYHTYVPK